MQTPNLPPILGFILPGACGRRILLDRQDTCARTEASDKRPGIILATNGLALADSGLTALFPVAGWQKYSYTGKRETTLLEAI